MPSAGARDVSLTSAKGRKDADTDKKSPVTQAELQEELQRFTGMFIDRISQAMGELVRTGTPEVSDAALRGSLLYASSSLEIATGPLPEVNLLDMLVFLRLCRESFETHWMPELYGDRGRVVLEAFRASENDLWHIAARVISPEQHTKLDALIEQWRQDNPDQFKVEGVRLTDFAQRAGQVEAARAQEAGGLLSSVKGATQAADQALLFADRALFLAQRMPFLIRWQARVGSREIVSDALSRVGSPSELMTQVQGLEPMVQQLPVLAERSGQAAHEARLLVGDVRPLLPSPEGLEKINETIAKTNELTLNTRQMLQELRELTPSDPNRTVATAKRGLDDALKRALTYLALLGGAWSAVWWGGYYLVKRLLARRAVHD